ncbi:hypothetical protein ABT224_20420 [Streptomyces sp. NPDC001584]|uniref:hypothetical protein n=1 Tax=Streptomyces sp. NPDC001584 TaxID=3154521 RepID=UPI0033164D08
MAGKAQAAWDGLNERQRSYLHVLFEHDQAAEEQRAADWASGRTMDDRTPAAEWRWIDVVTPGTKLTSVQRDLAKRDVRDPGVGSTLAALARAGLIEHEEVPRGRGRAVRAKLTRTGRAAVRAAIKAAPGRRTGELADWSWEILVRLWKADGAVIRAGGPAVERTFLDRRPPLAVQHEYPYYSISEAGRDHYRQSWARYAQLYPWIAAPDPEPGADPWPAAAQKELTRLRTAVDEAAADREVSFHRRLGSEREVARVRLEGRPRELSGEWEQLLAEQAQQVHELAAAHAQAREETAARHYREAEARLGPAIGAYVHGVLAAYRLQVENQLFDGAVTEAIEQAAAGAGTDWELPPRPPLCGLHDVDSALGGAWDTAAGIRTRRRPLPKQMTEPGRRTVGRGRYRSLIPDDPEPPPLEARLEQAWALARTADGQVSDGALRRSLHPPAQGAQPGANSVGSTRAVP